MSMIYTYTYIFIYLILQPWYYQAGSGVCLSKAKLLHYLLEGTAASHGVNVGDEEKDAVDDSNHVVAGMLLLELLPSSF